MLTAGVDLAAEPKGTALALIDWHASGAKVSQLLVGVTDDLIVGNIEGVAKLGIDCALGWPREFVNFLVQHSDVNDAPAEVDGGMHWRRQLSFRETDRHVREVTGRWPLSVSTDRLGVTALRASGLLSRLSRAGVNVDRSGSGGIVEVYPGAALRIWGFDTAGYKKVQQTREDLLNAIVSIAPWLHLGEFGQLMVESADAFDAVIAALCARSTALGLSTLPDAHAREVARVEGWISLPMHPISALAGR